MTKYSRLIDLLRRKKLTIATAESCTGGLVAKLLTDVPGASRVFIGGVVSYSNEMKMKWLGVKQETIVKYGAVSAESVREMLDGIMLETGADVAAAVSGIAGPTGGTAQKPVGTVFVGVAFRGERRVEKFLFKGSREQVREQSAHKIFELLLDIL